MSVSVFSNDENDVIAIRKIFDIIPEGWHVWRETIFELPPDRGILDKLLPLYEMDDEDFELWRRLQ